MLILGSIGLNLCDRKLMDLLMRPLRTIVGTGVGRASCVEFFHSRVRRTPLPPSPHSSSEDGSVEEL